MRNRLVVANWKMNGSLEANARWAEAFLALEDAGCDAAVCAPSVYLSQMACLLKGSSVALGAQDVNEFESGAYTGEVSARMLAEIGCSYVIVGHSERRALYGDTDDRVALKAKAALAAGIHPIVCVGETLEEREAGETIAVVSRQLEAVIGKVGAEDFARCTVAYEPVWAIGTGKVATTEQAQEVCAAIRACIGEIYDEATAEAIRIQYGGSVSAASAPELFAQANIDGGLVGGASLKPDFGKIVNYNK